MTLPFPLIDRLDEVTASYGALLCDVWGVVHNGEESFPDACAALARARGRGLAVVLITNSPRPSAGVETQLATLGVGREAYDRTVTSGDVTRLLVAEAPRRIFHLGPERDLPLYDGLDVDLVEEPEASAVVCTGLFHDETETPDDYQDLLRRLRARDLPMICANPDISVHRGTRLIWCAGSLARAYGQFGGRTLIAGKPYRPIYEAALAAAGEVLGRTVAAGEALAIGDGILTDVKGAEDNGIDVLYVSGGIHRHEYGETDAPDPERLGAFLARHGHRPVAVIPELR